MNEFSKQNTTINENMNETTMTNNKTAPSGDFVDAGDGFHKADGIAKIISLADGRTFAPGNPWPGGRISETARTAREIEPAVLHLGIRLPSLGAPGCARKRGS